MHPQLVRKNKNRRYFSFLKEIITFVKSINGLRMQTKCHLSVLIHEQAKKYGDKPALTFRSFGSLKWKTVSWKQFSLRVKQVSNALLNLGMKPQEKIAIFSQNCIHYLYTDYGAYGDRVVSIPIYATSSE